MSVDEKLLNMHFFCLAHYKHDYILLQKTKNILNLLCLVQVHVKKIEDRNYNKNRKSLR